MLVDTNIFLRTLQRSDPQHGVALRALARLELGGANLRVVPQVLVEFWAVATRPAPANGLGLSVTAAEAEIRKIRKMFRLLPETGQIYAAWERRVIQHEVSGKSVYDARLVAAMDVYGLESILTFNGADFERYGVTIVDPLGV